MEYPNPSFEALIPAFECYIGGSAKTAFTLRHQRFEPYTVELELLDGNVWRFDRSMLTTGMSARIGDGDVRVFPLSGDETLVGVAMKRDADGRVIVIKKELVEFFLNAIEHFSPIDEDRSAEIDEELRNWYS